MARINAPHNIKDLFDSIIKRIEIAADFADTGKVLYTLFADCFYAFSFCNFFLCYWPFCNNCISSRCFRCFCSLVFLPWFSSKIISWHVRVCRSNYILIRLHLLYVSSLFLCARMSRKSCRYPCIKIIHRECFIVSWSSWYWMLVHSVKLYWKLFMDPLNS